MGRGKDKLRRFNEIRTFQCVVEPAFEEVFRTDYKLKGAWRTDFFANQNPIVLELGCGRGEYTVALAERYPEKNFIGVDIKGARLWRGAKTATEAGMRNVGFIRTRIEFIEAFFAQGEVDEIWITFPDPQLHKSRVKKRLTAPEFLRMYAQFLRPDGCIHLKTDCAHLHEYTKATVLGNDLELVQACADIYGTGYADELLSIKTTYERKFLAQGVSITYLKFLLGGKNAFESVFFAPDAFETVEGEMLDSDSDSDSVEGAQVDAESGVVTV